MIHSAFIVAASLTAFLGIALSLRCGRFAGRALFSGVIAAVVTTLLLLIYAALSMPEQFSVPLMQWTWLRSEQWAAPVVFVWDNISAGVSVVLLCAAVMRISSLVVSGWNDDAVRSATAGRALFFSVAAVAACAQSVSAIAFALGIVLVADLARSTLVAERSPRLLSGLEPGRWVAAILLLTTFTARLVVDGVLPATGGTATLAAMGVGLAALEWLRSGNLARVGSLGMVATCIGVSLWGFDYALGLSVTFSAILMAMQQKVLDHTPLHRTESTPQVVCYWEGCVEQGLLDAPFRALHRAMLRLQSSNARGTRA